MRPVLGLLLWVAMTVALWPAGDSPGRADVRPVDMTAPAQEALVKRACAACHTVPPADVLPRDVWKKVSYEMAGMILGNVGAPRDAPPLLLDFDMDVIARYYEARAPSELPAPEPWPAPGAEAARFARHPVRYAGATEAPIVSHVRFLDLDGRGRLQVVATDMGAGLVLAGDPREPSAGLRLLGRVPNPAHAAAVDLDKDGLLDLLVADLGDFRPEDHEKGSVVWLRRRADGTYEPKVLAAGLPRVADVEAADFDGDSDLDLVVAAFGWRTVGAVSLFENRTTDWAAPRFLRREVDARAGSIHVPVADLNADGHPDFVALFAQHYETVEAFLNDGKGAFRAQKLFAGPHPAWGSSGLELVDLDKDGDLDVLVTNGDMLDDFFLKPYHGLRLLENLGGLRFEERFLANLPGIHRALAADVDGDGDQDVVAGAYVQFKTGGGPPRALADQASLVWLEQAAPGQWKRHTLERGGQHVALDVADYDGDGDIDLVVGQFTTRDAPSVELWENRTRSR
jgi:FG-GAP-like repeat